MMLNIYEYAQAFHGLKPKQNRAMNLINPPWTLVNVNVPIEVNESRNSGWKSGNLSPHAY